MSDFICIVMAGLKYPGSSRGSGQAIGSGDSGASDGRDKPGHDGKRLGHDGKKLGHEGKKATRS